MSAAKHTPGPWTLADRNKKGFAARIVSAEPNRIVADVYGGGEMGVVDANAKLIIAAPDHASLLAALVSEDARWEKDEGLLTIWEPSGAGHCFEVSLDDFGCPVVTDEIRAALAKAGRLP